MNKEARGFWSVGGCKIIEDPRIPIEKDDKPSFDKEAFRDLIENTKHLLTQCIVLRVIKCLTISL